MQTQRIAVVGSGMAGLAAAWICQRAGHQVTVFEAQNGRGMDAHTLEGLGDNGSGWVDVPLRVMSVHAWQSVLALCDELQLETFAVETLVSYSWLHNRKTWLRSGKFNLGGMQIPTIGSWRYLNRDAWIVGREIVRLARAIERMPDETSDQQPSLEEFFTSARFEPLFWRGFILPILTTICTCREEILLRWPAYDLLRLLKQVTLGKNLRRLKGGTRSLVNSLARDLDFVSGSPVVDLKKEANGVCLTNSRHEAAHFDKVIFATQANQLEFLRRAGMDRELDLLSSFEYDTGELIVHQDPSYMPKQKRDWTALNYLSDKSFSQSMFTVWVNPVEPSLKGDEPIFQTWNPLFEPKASSVLYRVSLQRAVVSRQNEKALAELAAMHDEPRRQVFFCGSWAAPGVPLLESAVRSAIMVTQKLGVHAAWDPKDQHPAEFVQPESAMASCQ